MTMADRLEDLAGAIARNAADGLPLLPADQHAIVAALDAEARRLRDAERHRLSVAARRASLRIAA